MPVDNRARACGQPAATIAIVGGGFSGLCLAAHLHRAPASRVEVLVIERGVVGDGLAFSTREPAHLLNGPAGNQSAFDDAPDDFVDFLAMDPQAAPFLDLTRPLQGQFVPRMLYARYLQRLAGRLRQPSPSGTTVHFVRNEVRSIEREPGRMRLFLADGTELCADAVVLAIGHPSPRSLANRIAPRHLIDNPWDGAAVRAIPPDAPVAIVGSGQTATDLVLGLVTNGHRGRITMLSRRGRIALPYIAVKRPYSFAGDPPPPRLRALVRRVRVEAQRFARDGGDWRAVINALRPYTQDLWQGFSLAEKRRFLDHLAPFWYIHRSRLTPSSAVQFEQLLATGQVQVLAGQILGSRPGGAGLVLDFRLRGSESVRQVPAAAVINCTGPCWDISRPQNPLVANLLADGPLRWDELGRGIAVTPYGAPLDASGRTVPGLFAIGPMGQGSLLEIIGIRDIRTQCAELVEHLLADTRIEEGVQEDVT